MRMQTTTLQRTFLAAGLIGALTLGGFAASDAAAPSGPGVAVTTSGSVSQTVNKLKKMVSNNGMMVMNEINQGKILSMTGLHVQSDTLFVGNPRVGKKLFSADPGVGIVVPIRINIYKAGNGKTVVRYIPPSKQLDAFNNPKVKKVAQMLDQKLHKMTSMIGQ